VQVFKHKQQGLPLALTQQHALECFEGALAALRRLERTEGAVVGQDVQQLQQGGEGLL
jgi:hypothetical protein